MHLHNKTHDVCRYVHLWKLNKAVKCNYYQADSSEGNNEEELKVNYMVQEKL